MNNPSAANRKEFASKKTVVYMATIYLFLIVQIASFHSLRHDDAYISFHYGQNLATGNGLVFNKDERIMGSTSPGQSLLSALVYSVVGKKALPSVMSSLGCIAWTAQGLALFLLFSGVFSITGAAFVSLCVLGGALHSYSWVALETNTAFALSLWAIVASRHRRWHTTAILASLAGLMRPDAYLVAVIIGVLCILELKRASLKPIALFLLLSLPWVLFSWFYYGSPIPQSAVAKFHRADVATYAAHLFFHPAKQFIFLKVTSIPGTVFLWATAILGSAYLVKRDRRLVVLPLYFVLHCAAYLYLRPFTMHTWHLYPTGAIFSTFCLGAIAFGYDKCKEKKAARLVAICVMVCVFAGVTKETFSAAMNHETAYWSGARDKVYLAIADVLKSKVKPNERVASVEVGTIAYWSGAKMLDLGGLTSSDLGKQTALRWIVLDKIYLHYAPPGLAPMHTSKNGEFVAFIFNVNPRKKGK